MMILLWVLAYFLAGLISFSIDVVLFDGAVTNQDQDIKVVGVVLLWPVYLAYATFAVLYGSCFEFCVSVRNVVSELFNRG